MMDRTGAPGMNLETQGAWVQKDNELYITQYKILYYCTQVMHRLFIQDAEQLVAEIESQLAGSPEFRFFKKLYTLLLVARNRSNNCSEAARQLGYSPQTIARWVHRVSVKRGYDFKRLRDKQKPGRPKRLTNKPLSILKIILTEPPKIAQGATKWTGTLLSDYLKQEFDVDIQVRQCQKIMASLRSSKKLSSNA